MAKSFKKKSKSIKRGKRRIRENNSDIIKLHKSVKKSTGLS